MAALTTTAIISLIALGASTGTAAYAAHKQGSANKKAGEAGARVSESEAQLAEYNAGIADLQATDAIATGALEESKFRTGVRGLIGEQRAAFAGSGVDVGFGSAVDVQADTAFLGELDALQIRTNARRAAWGFQVQAIDLRKRAKIAREGGQMQIAAAGEAARAGNVAAFGTILGGTVGYLQTRYGGGGSAPSTRVSPSLARAIGNIPY